MGGLRSAAVGILGISVNGFVVVMEVAELTDDDSRSKVGVVTNEFRREEGALVIMDVKVS